MGILKSIKQKHPDLFDYIDAKEVHPHDHLMKRVVLKYLPDSVTPNKVTSFRVLATPIVFLLILYGYYGLGAFAFLFVAFTDAVDGSLARTKNQITKFGILFDPLADKLLIGAMVLLLVFRYFDFWLGVAILGIEIIFIVSALFSGYRIKKIRMANGWGKIKMFLQVLAVFITLMALLLDFPELLSVAALIFGVAIGAAVLSLFSHGL